MSTPSPAADASWWNRPIGRTRRRDGDDPDAAGYDGDEADAPTQSEAGPPAYTAPTRAPQTPADPEAPASDAASESAAGWDTPAPVPVAPPVPAFPSLPSPDWSSTPPTGAAPPAPAPAAPSAIEGLSTSQPSWDTAPVPTSAAASSPVDAPSGDSGEGGARPVGSHLATMSAAEILAEARDITDRLLEHLHAGDDTGAATGAATAAGDDSDLHVLLELGLAHLDSHPEHAVSPTLRLVCTAVEAELARRHAEQVAAAARGLAESRAAADASLDAVLEARNLGSLGAVKVDDLLESPDADTLTVELVQYSLTARSADSLAEAGGRDAFLSTLALTLGVGTDADPTWGGRLAMLLDLHGDDDAGIEDWWTTCGRGADGNPALTPSQVAAFSYQPLDALTEWWTNNPDATYVPAPLHRTRAVFGIHRLTPAALAAAQEAAATGFAIDADAFTIERGDIAAAATNATVLAYQMRSSGRRTTAAAELRAKLPTPHRDLVDRLLAE